MANELINKTAVDALPPEMSRAEKADLIQQKVADLMSNASMAQVEENFPEYLETVKALLEQMVVHDPAQQREIYDPLRFTEVTRWAFKDQAELGLEMLEILKIGPGEGAVKEVDAFETKLRERIAPLEQRIAVRKKRKKAENSWRARFARFITARLESDAQKRNRQSAELTADEEEIRIGNEDLSDIITKTCADTITLQGLLAANKDQPRRIQDKIKEAYARHGEGADKLYLALVAVCETQRRILEEIRLFESAADSGAVMVSDMNKDGELREAAGFLETHKTNIKAAIVKTMLQRVMVNEMSSINANSALQIEQLEASAIPMMIDNLGDMAIQLRTGDSLCVIKAVNRITREAAEANAEGFGRVLDLSKESDKAMLAAQRAVVAATEKTLQNIAEYRVHTARQIVEQKKVQKELEAAVTSLVTVSARIGNYQPAAKQTNADQQEAKNLARILTGVDLEDAKKAADETVQPQGKGKGPQTVEAVIEDVPVVAEEPKPEPPEVNPADRLFKKARDGQRPQR